MGRGVVAIVLDVVVGVLLAGIAATVLVGTRRSAAFESPAWLWGLVIGCVALVAVVHHTVFRRRAPR